MDKQTRTTIKRINVKQSYFFKTLSILLVFTGFTLSTNADVREDLANKLPNISPEQITPSPVKDVYAIDLGERFAYVTADGKFLFSGELIDMELGVNHSQIELGKKRVDTIASIPERNFIVFPAKDKKHSVTVFTDIDCTWCRRLHAEIESYTDLGIEVRYLLRPRSGQQSKSWQKADSVFCSKNQQKTFTRAKQGQDITVKTCENSPVKENVIMSEKLGFMGTPVVLSEGGQYLGGYVAADQLIKKLDTEKAGT